MSPEKGQVDGCRTGVVLVLLAAAALLLALGGVVHAQEEWDRSSIAVNGNCQPGNLAAFTIVNQGSDMAGPSTWRVYKDDVLWQSGEFQLAAGTAEQWTFVSAGVPIRFEADQRVGHPGNSHPRLTLTCGETTAVTLRSFSAINARPLSAVCQKGVVVDFKTVNGGHVVWVVREGHSLSDSYWTCRHFSITQRVTVCAGIVN